MPKRTGGRGWESARPPTPHTQARGAPPGRPRATSQRAKPARKSAGCGVDDGLARPHPPHPDPPGSGPRPHAPKDERSGSGGARNPGRSTPRQEAPPAAAPSCCPHSAQSQLARARAVGLVTVPQAQTPRTHSQWVVGPGRTPQRTGSRVFESARTQTPHTKAKSAPPGRPRAALTAHKASSQERALWGW